MEREQKEQLLDQFREYLDTLPEKKEPLAQDDTFGLHAELSGLRNEVHIESRQLKKALDDFRAVITSLEDTNKLLEQQLAEARNREKKSTRDAVRPLLAALIDLLDRCTEAAAVTPPAKTFFTFRYERRLFRWIRAQLEGMGMLRQRLADITEGYGLKPVQCTGKPFVAEYMQAVGTEYDPTREEGIVLAEVRTGFLLHGEPIRPAEVIVNRKKEDSSV